MRLVKDIEVAAVHPGGEVKDARLRWLLSKDHGAPTFAVRRFEVEAGGHTERHSHAWEQAIYILQGKGAVWTEQGERDVEPGHFVYLGPHEAHQFLAKHEQKLCFLCIIPNSAY